MIAINTYIQVLQKYAVFDGRANRPEYWWFALVSTIISVVLVIAAFAVSFVIFFVYVVYTLAVLLPSFGVTVRRLHDSGRSAWWLLVGFIPFIGGIVMIVLMALGSEAGENRYGPQPE